MSDSMCPASARRASHPTGDHQGQVPGEPAAAGLAVGVVAAVPVCDHPSIVLASSIAGSDSVSRSASAL